MGFRCKYSHSRQEQWEQRPLVLQWMWRNRWIIQLDGWEKRVHSGEDTVGLETQWTIVETWGAQLPFDENRVCGMSTLSELLTEWCCNTFSWIQKHEKAFFFFDFDFFFFLQNVQFVSWAFIGAERSPLAAIGCSLQELEKPVWCPHLQLSSGLNSLNSQ